MKSPLMYASRCLSDMEDRWIPYSSLWWRFWTPHIPVGERYQEGAFNGYTNDDSSSSSDSDDDQATANMALLDIRRMLAVPMIRRIYKKLPYIDVVPVKRPYSQMPADQQRQREAFVIESTLTAYRSGKALYTRQTIQQIETQLLAAATKLAARRARRNGRKSPFHLNLRARLFAHCEAPQTAFVAFPALDGVTTHLSTWSPGAELTLSDGTTVYRPGRPQVEFRTVQELTQPDPENGAEQFVPDSWMAAVGYQPVSVSLWRHPDEMLVVCAGGANGGGGGVAGDGVAIGVELMEARLEADCKRVLESGVWEVFRERAVLGDGVVAGVDKVVFFYASGMGDDCDYCQRAMFLFAVAVCLRDLAAELRSPEEKRVPIYMPAYDMARRWGVYEKEFLQRNGVEFVDSNGELFLKVDERTAVVSYRNWNPVKQVVADIAKPAVLVCRPVSWDPEEDFAWKDLEVEDGEPVRVPKVRARFIEVSTILDDPDSPRVRKLVQDYDEFQLPDLPGETAQKEMSSMYLRKADASIEVEYW
ncbi:hypothetical protein C8A00DRAFT_14095 [Chaetomidium leptoderma]|uniref:SRR1-like domain-containing protein n=1 Tax=Chaetomidium leptoderma TaxID=669021 RepID=A0AAN6VQ37_9PEZI|nr:hypothetical protein C8A00DRAFT_14095 [Chaetomidium leptoderma]